MSQIVLENETNYNVDIKFLETILHTLSLQEVELIITNNLEIQEINLSTRNIDKPTDVLSFPYEKMPHVPLGSIVISVDFVEEKAKQYKHTFNDELALLFIHGLLHLLGFDHEKDNGEHRNKEKEMIKQFNLPSSLIIRTQEEEK